MERMGKCGGATRVMCRSDLLGSGLMQNLVAKKFGLEGRSVLWKVVNMS